jgi:nanoRNase/pAp phosphatase (c-di-AMP/oligoRNAs hydrolase)
MELIALCTGRSVYIQTHNFPDPDAIASAFALQKLFEHFGISSTICYEGKIDKLSASKMLQAFGIEMLSYGELKSRLRESDYIICVDSQKNSGNITDFIGDEVASIDHHPTFTKVDYKYSDIQIVGACATLIAEYYRTLGITPDKDTATALLYGIKMDTMQFSRGVTERDIDMFAFLFPYADNDVIISLESNNMQFQDLRSYGAAIENIRVFGYIGFSRIPFPCPDAMIAILADFVLSLLEVEVAVIYCERDNGLKFSIRSERSDVHAGNVIRAAFNGIGDGGGHASMAGGFISKDKYELLGAYPDDFIRDRFMDAISSQNR